MMWEPVTPDQEAAAEAGRQAVLSADPYLDEPGLFSRLRSWLLEQFDGVDTGNVDGGWISDLLRMLDALVPWLLVALAVVVGWWIWRNRSSLAMARGAGGSKARVDHQGPQQSASDWLAQSRRCAARGEHAAAVRAAYRAIVVHLVDDELVPATPGLTVGDHRGMIRRSEVMDALQAEGFATASDIFERAWYGPAADAELAAADLADLAAADLAGADDGAADGPRAGAIRVAVAPVTAAEVDVVMAAAIRLGVGQ